MIGSYTYQGPRPRFERDEERRELMNTWTRSRAHRAFEVERQLAELAIVAKEWTAEMILAWIASRREKLRGTVGWPAISELAPAVDLL